MEFKPGPDIRHAMASILMISDEPVSAKVWAYSLSQIGYEVNLVDIHAPVVDIITTDLPDLAIIEDFDDQVEELDLCRQMRAAMTAPILFLTSKQGEAFQLEAYQAGADECILFPVTPRLLQAKVSAWLRRIRSIPLAALDEVRAGGYQLNTAQRRLTLPTGATVRLSVLESRALFLLISHPGQGFQADEVVEKVWGYQGSGDREILKHLVYRLRKKIERDPNQPQVLLFDRSSGYRFGAVSATG